MMTLLEKRRTARPTALLLAASLVFPVCVIGCGGKGADTANVPAPVDDTRGGRMTPAPGMQPAQPPKTGMSTGKKVAIVLAGAALLYYLHKRHEKQNGQEVQYYKSKNGRIYYRDAQTHQAHWVTPAASYELTDEEQQELKRYKGYNNSTGGEDYDTGNGADNGGEPQ